MFNVEVQADINGVNVHTTSNRGFTPEEIADGLREWFSKDKTFLKAFLNSQETRKKIIDSRSFSVISMRLLNIIQSLELNN